MTTSWSTEEVDALRQYSETCNSFAGVCCALNKKFGTNRSRSSICSKAKRIGLKHVYVKTLRALPLKVKRGVYTRSLPRQVSTTILPDRGKCAWPDSCQSTVCVGAYCLTHAKLAYTVFPDKARSRKFQL